MTRRVHRGFTLIEMVIALAILATALPVLYGVFIGALSRMHRDVRLGEATLLAQSVLARAGSEYSNPDQPLRGKWNEFEYQLTEVLVPAPEGQRPYTQPTVHVTARVTWPSGSGARDLVLTSQKLWVAKNEPR